MIVTFHIFILDQLLLTVGGIELYICEACLDLNHCAAEASTYDLVYAVLVSPIFLSFRIREIS